MTESELQSLIEEFRVPRHVVRHCRAVADFATALAEALRAQGERVDVELVRQAALLHDIVRVVDFREFHPEKFPDSSTEEDREVWRSLRARYAGRHHAEAGAEVLRERGFDRIAQVVEKHRYIQILEGFSSWEEKLVYYADKRTKHDKVVTLSERLEDGRKRNAPEQIGLPQALEMDAKIFELEKEILSRAGLTNI